MNRPHGYELSTREAPLVTREVPREQPAIPDHLIAACCVCRRPGDLVIIRCQGYLSYAHPGCVSET